MSINDELNKKIGIRLKECRNAKKMTQAELAEASNLSIQHISYIENGKRKLTLEVARNFSRILGVQEKYLLYQTDCATEADEKIKENEMLDARDCAFMDYLRSIGYDPFFYLHGYKPLRDYMEYVIGNNISGKYDHKVTFHGYSNNVKMQFEGKSFIVPNATIYLDHTEFDIVDFLDLMDDVKEYTIFLIERMKERKKRRLEHIRIEHENQRLEE